ncbi:MAG: class I SAM-dependent methyltransferase [bacterium]|nr:class I SAM-dependent methyltransferase [bacterium]
MARKPPRDPAETPTKKLFADQADVYSAYRPGYPAEMFAYFAGLAPGRALAWDCGTGSGQAAVGVAEHFDCVVATDASPEQLDHATPHDRVEYRHAPVESAPLDDHSVDLITVGQALHWFNHDAFYNEVRRVAAPGGVIAAWGYLAADIDEAMNTLMDYYRLDLVGSYWSPRVKYMVERYETIPFPFEDIDTPDFTATAEWSLDHWVGFLRSWSSTQEYLRQHGENPVDIVLPKLREAWGEAKTRLIRWPLFCRVGCVG